MPSTTRETDERFADLFVELTGRTTIEEGQGSKDSIRVSDPNSEVGRYVAETARQTGLDDAIDTSEDY